MDPDESPEIPMTLFHLERLLGVAVRMGALRQYATVSESVDHILTIEGYK